VTSTRTTAKEQKIIAPLQALGSNDAKEILLKLLRIVQKHADKEGVNTVRRYYRGSSCR
jgi:hypothetical protein